MKWLLLITALVLSAIAAWYSVAGLVAIFAAAAIPIIIMGGSLEAAKLVTVSYLHQQWRHTPGLLRTYLCAAVLVLMLITSMGIFGFLSKAHLDQGVPTGDVQARLELIDGKIKTERDNIESYRKALKQLDDQVDQVLARSTSEQGARRAANLRNSQRKERESLNKNIESSQNAIVKLNNERSPIAAEVRKVEAEVGPIKYIAALIYDENPNADILEKAIRWVIILLVAVFDPLAVALLLAWNRMHIADAPKPSKSKPVVVEPMMAEPEPEPVMAEPEPVTTPKSKKEPTPTPDLKVPPPSAPGIEVQRMHTAEVYTQDGRKFNVTSQKQI